ncbi:MAG: hypothetical protein MJ172_11250 [Clostridia bacterium]|nr:hypothetical protein [Clostridia bacterium]
MDYCEFFDLHNIRYQKGLSDEEFNQIESLYSIVFPDELRKMYKQALPVSEGFYNWRDLSDDNIELIKKAINRPFEYFYKHASEVYWNDEWGEKSDSIDEIRSFVREKLSEASQLIPIFAHRYMPMINDITNPIFSIHGIDIIIYGESLDEYLKVEFGEKKQSSTVLLNSFNVPFWSEVI